MRYCRGMLRRSALVIAVVAAACIKLSEFHPLDAPGSGTPDAHTADAALPGECGNGAADQATALMSGTSVCAAGPGYVLRFPARGFDYPDQLRIGSQDLLGTTTTCNEDDRVGITVYPIARFSSDTVATGETASATIVLAGPVVAKGVVNWSWQPAAACPSPAAGTQAATTAYQIGTAPCSAAIAAVAQYDNPGGHQLHVTNDSGFDTLVPTENDGMYGGDGGTGGALQACGTLTLKTDTGPIAPGWALSVTGAIGPV